MGRPIYTYSVAITTYRRMYFSTRGFSSSGIRLRQRAVLPGDLEHDGCREGRRGQLRRCARGAAAAMTSPGTGFALLFEAHLVAHRREQLIQHARALLFERPSADFAPLSANCGSFAHAALHIA
jgi:hypothetical protein